MTTHGLTNSRVEGMITIGSRYVFVYKIDKFFYPRFVRVVTFFFLNTLT